MEEGQYRQAGSSDEQYCNYRRQESRQEVEPVECPHQNQSQKWKDDHRYKSMERPQYTTIGDQAVKGVGVILHPGHLFLG